MRGMAQDQPSPTPPAAGPAATPAAPSAPVAEKAAPAPTPEQPDRKLGHYMVHQSLEAGGRITEIQGSQAMWNTLVNTGSGGRILSQSLELRTTDRSKTPLFDTLTTNSFGYGGDANNVSYLNFSKGHAYDFAGSFRRDRQYFDYNLLANSLNSNSAGLVPEIDSPHLFNTVRRNTDALLTVLPLSRVSFRAGFNHNLSQGPSYSSVHEGADGLLFQNWANTNDTYTGGVDVKLVKRTTLSFDQFYVHYKGNTSWQLAGLNEELPNGTPVSYGLDPGSGKCPGVVNGVGSATCNGYLAMSIYEPTRTNFPTEQLRFSSRYWERIAVNGRVLYSGGKSIVPNYYESFNGLVTRTGSRGEIDTGAGPGGQLSTVKRDNVNADLGLVAELSKRVTVTEAYNFWDFRMPGSNQFTSTVYVGHSMLMPGTATPPATSENSTYLNQKIETSTTMGTFAVAPQFKFSVGYRYRFRNITDYGPDDLSWKENWVLLGAVFQPGQMFRLNVDYDEMHSRSDAAFTPSNTYTRLMPDKVSRFKARGTVKPAKWLSLAFAGLDYEGRNDDPLVNHRDHNRDLSLNASIHPGERFGVDFDVAHDDVLSMTDDCYVITSAPSGAANAGTCTVAASGVGIGDPSYRLSNAYYHAPATFFSGALNYAPMRRLRLNGGLRLNDVNGQSEMLNPNMIPGALRSKYVTPFTDLQYEIAREWTWHGNWTRNDYSEQGPMGILAPRNVHGDIATLGVKYAF